MYRDLKPANVLIDMTGHVKLADLGGAVKACAEEENDLVASNSTPFSTFSTATPKEDVRNLEHPARRRSILGTMG